MKSSTKGEALGVGGLVVDFVGGNECHVGVVRVVHLEGCVVEPAVVVWVFTRCAHNSTTVVCANPPFAVCVSSATIILVVIVVVCVLRGSEVLRRVWSRRKATVGRSRRQCELVSWKLLLLQRRHEVGHAGVVVLLGRAHHARGIPSSLLLRTPF